jgi:hypothetical protein
MNGLMNYDDGAPMDYSGGQMEGNSYSPSYGDQFSDFMKSKKGKAMMGALAGGLMQSGGGSSGGGYGGAISSGLAAGSRMGRGMGGQTTTSGSGGNGWMQALFGMNAGG